MIDIYDATRGPKPVRRYRRFLEGGQPRWKLWYELVARTEDHDELCPTQQNWLVTHLSRLYYKTWISGIRRIRVMSEKVIFERSKEKLPFKTQALLLSSGQTLVSMQRLSVTEKQIAAHENAYRLWRFIDGAEMDKPHPRTELELLRLIIDECRRAADSLNPKPPTDQEWADGEWANRLLREWRRLAEAGQLYEANLLCAIWQQSDLAAAAPVVDEYLSRNIVVP